MRGECCQWLSASHKYFEDGVVSIPAANGLWTSQISERRLGHWSWQRDSTVNAVSQYCWTQWDWKKGQDTVCVKSENVLQSCRESGWFLERENILKRKIRAHLSKVRAGCWPRAASGTQNKFGDQFNLGRTSMCLQDFVETNNFTLLEPQ